MFTLEWQLRAFHVIANLFWIGSICAVGFLLVQKTGSARERGALAHRVYTRIANPAFGIAFLLGAARLLMDLSHYFVQTRFMHPKLTFALAVIALHHVIGARAKKMARGDTSVEGKGLLLTPLLAILAVAAAWFGLTKPF